MSRTGWPVAALVAAVLALYAGALRAPLVFDDNLLTVEFMRAYARSGFHFDLRWFSYASFGWTFATFGADRLWLRLGNVLLHAATCAALFGFLRLLFERHAIGKASLLAFAGALLFAVHPVAVYGVAYLMQRSIVMATLFSLLALACLLQGLSGGSKRWLAASVACYFAAVFSKEHAVALPAVAALLVVMSHGTSWRRLRSLGWLFGCYAAIALLVTLKQKGVLGATYEPFAQLAVRQLAESAPAHAGGPLLWLRSIENQALLFFRYLGTWFLPYPGWMSIDVRSAFPTGAAGPAYLAGLTAWLAYPLLALWGIARGGRAALAGFGLLAPWLGLTEFVAIRVQEPFLLYRSYLWMSLLPAALPALLSSWTARRVAWVLAALVLAWVPATLERLHSFSSEVAVWDDAVRKNTNPAAPLAERPYRNRGVALYKEERYQAALSDFERALAIDPRSAQAWLTRGTLYMRVGETGRALSDFDQALALDPQDAEALGRRCVVLMRLQRYSAALEDCRAARDADPFVTLNHVSLGMVHALLGDPRNAEESYRRALELNPRSADAHYQYGVLLGGTGRPVDARAHFAAACGAGMAKACEGRPRLGPRPLQ